MFGLLRDKDAAADEEGGLDFVIAKWGRKTTVLGGTLKSERGGKSQDRGTGDAAAMGRMEVRNAKRNGQADGQTTTTKRTQRDKRTEKRTTPVGLRPEVFMRKKPANLDFYKGLFPLGKSSMLASDKQVVRMQPRSQRALQAISSPHA